MKKRRLAAFVLLSILTLSGTSLAQGDDAVTVQARARFKEGVEAYDKGRYEEARLAFLQAYTLKKHPSVLLNLAQSSAKSNHPLEAARYFSQFLREATTATPQQKKDAEQGLAEVRKQVARIDVAAPSGTEITLDDQKVGTTPFDALDVEPGQHTLKSPTQSVTVTAVVGQKVEARFGSSSASPPPSPTPAPAPSDSSTSPPPRENAAAAAVTVDADKSKKTSLLTPPENMTPVYVGLGVGGVGLIGTIVFFAFKTDAQSKADKVAADIRAAATARGIPSQGACNSTAPSAADLKNACATLKDNNSKVDTNATIANISAVVMGVGLLTAGIWYLAGPKRDDNPKSAERKPMRPTLTPYAGWQSGGLMLSGEL